MCGRSLNARRSSYAALAAAAAAAHAAAAAAAHAAFAASLLLHPSQSVDARLY